MFPDLKGLSPILILSRAAPLSLPLTATYEGGESLSISYIFKEGLLGEGSLFLMITLRVSLLGELADMCGS